jgi:hypothetical protein
MLRTLQGPFLLTLETDVYVGKWLLTCDTHLCTQPDESAISVTQILSPREILRFGLEYSDCISGFVVTRE